ncbi:hypothetical protein, partial [Streptococcus suis]|uniref:hypothetical protein n=1 Tax=Streptococcus suis TaxID=1307 RepID=UPI003F88E841
SINYLSCVLFEILSKQGLQQLNQTFSKEDLAALFVSMRNFFENCYLFLKILKIQKKDECWSSHGCI